MRISQLAAAADLPVATVKFYLREGLLHEGRLTSATQADYDDAHVRRLNLIRALIGPAELSLASARAVLSVLDHPPTEPLALLEASHRALSPNPGATGGDPTRAQALLDRWGWDADCVPPETMSALAHALGGLDSAGFDLSDATLDRYAHSMFALADQELAETPLDSPESAARYAVLGTILVEPVMLTLRRIAQAQAAVRRFGADQGGIRA